MTREEAINEINKVFTSAYANYIVTALTEGATVSDKEQGTTCIQAIYTDALEEGIRCAMCTNTIKSDTGCDGGCIVDTKMYNKVMTEINSRLLRKIPREGHWIMTGDYFTGAYESIDYVKCSCCGEESLEEGNYCPNCGADMREVKE